LPGLTGSGRSRRRVRCREAAGSSVYSAGAGRAEKGYEIRTLEGPGFYRKIVLDGGILKGLIFVGEMRNEGLCNSLIGMKVDVSAYVGSLLRGSYGYSRHLARACRLPA